MKIHAEKKSMRNDTHLYIYHAVGTLRCDTNMYEAKLLKLELDGEGRVGFPHLNSNLLQI